MKQKMRKIIVLSLLILFCCNCYAQHRIPIYTLSYQFEKKTESYNIKAHPLKSGKIFVYDTVSNILYQCIIEEEGIRLPPSCVSNNCWIALYTNGEYYCTSTFYMDSILRNAQYWSFHIDENSYSKKILGAYFFSLSVSPLECGRVKYNNKFQYHRRSKKMVKDTRKMARVIVS